MLSYRGPNAAGGVSNALNQIFHLQSRSIDWWYLVGNELRRDSAHPELNLTVSVDNHLIDQHYGYCNNFLWPVLHDLPHFAHYSSNEHAEYRKLSKAVASQLRGSSKTLHEPLFVNDYQFAMVPALIRGPYNCFVFWHIPWPRLVEKEHVGPLAELAIGLLNARAIGFHTREYLDNFFAFVRRYLCQFEVDSLNCRILCRETDGAGRLSETALVVAPLGIDLQYWTDLSKKTAIPHSNIPSIPYVLSIDRCDFTKGVAERLEALDHFFQHHIQWRTKLTFVQVGSRSRIGLAAFDDYWRHCRKRADEINARWASNGWHPLNWIEEPVHGESLASLYSGASLMLVSPLRDGLNLTAKEFAACQHVKPGILALSPGAGAWHELKEGCITVDPLDPAGFAQSIAQCIEIDERERYRRSHLLRESLQRNTLGAWWKQLTRWMEPHPGEINIDRSNTWEQLLTVENPSLLSSDAVAGGSL